MPASRSNSFSSDDYKTQFLGPSTRKNTSHYPMSNGMRRVHKILTKEELDAGKKPQWFELEITGTVRYLSQDLWKFRHLTALFLNGNQLTR